MSKEAISDVEFIGRNRIPDSLRRDLIAPYKVPKDSVVARILLLSALHPDVIEPYFDDLDEKDSATLNKLLKDIEETLGVLE